MPRLWLLCAVLLRRARGEEKFLVPILLFGPNTQFDALLEAAAIAKLTRRTLVLPKHFAKCDREDESRIPFEDVFDVEALQAYVPCTFATDALIDLYKRKMEWVTLASNVKREQLTKAMALLNLPCCASRLHVIAPHARATTLVCKFREAHFADATFVALAPLFALFAERDLLEAAARARAATLALFGGSAFLAVHVRRDSTLGCEARGRRVICPVVAHLLLASSRTADLVLRITTAAKLTGANAVYLAHAGNGAAAGEKEALIRALSAANVTVRSASTPPELATILGLDRPPAPFEVSLVEQEICATAAAFLPSARSTWSNAVSLDRRTRNRTVLRDLDYV
ncbi:hypothetical protein M885DRAFT_621880 [Pelagophyceae sp. CCMP2097]|nr:hypothetical protein M885DRAFT_621880 [Pelagophyceae sp. CCMP2097]